MTHLFGADVLTEKNHPRNWNTWDNDLCSDFNGITSYFLSPLTSNKIFPEHSALFVSISTKQGSLGIQHPRSTAILAYFLTINVTYSKYATGGVWTSNRIPTIHLPGHPRSLYRGWQDNSSCLHYPPFRCNTMNSRQYASTSKHLTETLIFYCDHQPTDARKR